MARLLVIVFVYCLGASYWTSTGGNPEYVWMSLMPLSFICTLTLLKS